MKSDPRILARFDRYLQNAGRDPDGYRRRIEEAHRRVMHDRESRQQDTDTAWNAIQNSSKSTCQTPVDPDSIFYPLASEIGEATSFTVGLVTVGRAELSHLARQIDPDAPCPIQEMVVAMAQQLAMPTYCVRIGGNHVDNRIVHSIPSDDRKVHVCFEGWDAPVPTRTRRKSQGLDLSMHLHALPQLKKQYPLVVLDLGLIDHAWIETMSRVCDSVYTLIPSVGALHPVKALASLRRLQRHHVRISGSWIVRAA